jgi:hypothetical protein
MAVERPLRCYKYVIMEKLFLYVFIFKKQFVYEKIILHPFYLIYLLAE